MVKTRSSSSKNRVAIVAGLRTPFTRQATFFKQLSAIELGQMVVTELLERSEIDPGLIERVVYGQVVILPEAPNIAREIVLGTRLPVSCDAYSVSKACATSLQTTINIAEAIMAGDIEIGISGGADSASVMPVQSSRKLATTLIQTSRSRSLQEKLKLFSRLRLPDLLPVAPSPAEYSTGLSMGDSAEQMAKDHGISRDEQDAFAHRSHSLAAKAWESGAIEAEVMHAYAVPYKKTLLRDENVRFDSKLENYKRLKPVFDRKYGTVTAANSTPLSDGASVLLMMSESRAKELGYEPMGYLKTYATAASEVKRDLLMGPSYATPIALDRAKMKLTDLNLIEMHEAFASQTLANIKAFASKTFAKEKLKRNQPIGEIDMEKFNVLGGSLAYGHPFAATGARLITQMLRELLRRGGGSGLVTACAAGGLGVSMILETE